MKDFIFYPLIIAIAVAMVVFSLMFGEGRDMCGPFGGAAGPADYSFAVIEERDLCRMEAGSLATDLKLNDAEDILSIRSNTDTPSPDPLRNPHFKLGPDLETVYAGRVLTVTMTVKPSDAGGAMVFEANYSTGKAGGSGWETFQMKPGWNSYVLTFEVPEKLLENTVAEDYFSIRPVVPDAKARSIELKSIEFRPGKFWNQP